MIIIIFIYHLFLFYLLNLNILYYYFLNDTSFLIGIVGGGAQVGPIGTAATIMAAPGDYHGGEIGGMIGRGN
jgi:hypothetical protein